MSFDDDLAHAWRLWNHGEPPPSPFESLERIERVVSEWFKVPVETMRTRTKQERVVYARFVAMYLARKITAKSFSAIARYFSRHHSDVIHGCRQVRNRIEREPGFSKQIDRLEARVRVGG